MLRRVLPLLLVAATLTACDDPSNVGLGLVGGEGGEPTIQHVPATPFTSSDRKEFTGGTTYVLAGRVDDPLLGAVEAEGYVDFTNPVAFGQGSLTRFRGATLTGAYLELPRGYVYGDTMTAVGFALHPVTEEFSQTGAHAQSEFSTGAALTSFSYPLPDTTVRVTLPATWIAAADTALRSTASVTSFHGFKLRATSGNAVLGFDPEEVRLFAITAQDTVVFSGIKSVSATRRLSAPNLPPGYIALQDGLQDTTASAIPRQVSYSYRVNFDLAQRTDGLNRLALELAYDSVLTQQTPPNFVRPRLDLIEVVGIDADGNVLATSSGDFFLRVTGAPGAQGRIVFASRRLTAAGRDLLLPGRQSEVKALLVQAPQLLGTLNAIVLHAPGTAQAPRFSVTVTPSE